MLLGKSPLALGTLSWLQWSGRGLRKEKGLKNGAFQETTLATVLG